MRGALVLLHAFPLNARMWEPQLALADRGWRVITPQLAGFDETAELGSVGGQVPVKHKDTCPPDSGTGLHTTRGDLSPVSIDDYAGDVIDLLDALHIHEAVIGGLSMGGYVALAIFRHAPRYFQGLVLADTRADADTPEGVEGRKRMMALVREQGASAVADEMIPKLLGETTRAGDPAAVERVRSLILSSSPAAIAGALHALMTRPDSTPLLTTIRCPALILVGDEDTVTPRPLSEVLHRRIAGSELAVIPRAGHLSSLERPDAFNDALGHFLDHRV
jgi:3-oxoadipate enol-lactonase